VKGLEEGPSAPASTAPSAHDVFEIRLPVFEGPLDLLLHLLEKEELDITSVSLVQVTDQYMSHLHALDEINMDVLADFIAVGAKLLLLKSRALLPQEPVAPEEGEEEDVGEELARLLIEYRRFKEAASALREREEQGLRSYPRLGGSPEVPLSLGLDRVTLRKLSRIFREALQRLPAEEEGIINRQEVSIREKVEEILAALVERGQLSFRHLVSACRSRLEVVVSFLAVLELIKSSRLRAEQSELFGDIRLLAPGDATDEP
jgi:segregation and condensation protein A